MKRKVLSCIIVLTMIVSLIPVVSFAEIISVDISDSLLIGASLGENSYEYDGTAKTPSIVVKHGLNVIFSQNESGSTTIGFGLKEGDTDNPSKAEYVNNVEAGTATVKVKLDLEGLLYSYSGTTEKSFTITKRPIASDELFAVNSADRSKTIDALLKDTAYSNIYRQACEELNDLNKSVSKEFDGNTDSSLTKAYAIFITSPYSYDLVAVEGTATYNSSGVSDKAKISFTPSSIWGSQSNNYYLSSKKSVVLDSEITKKSVEVAPMDTRTPVNETPTITFSAGGTEPDAELTEYIESLSNDNLVITDENGKQIDLSLAVVTPGKYFMTLKADDAAAKLKNYTIIPGKATLTVRGESSVSTVDRYKMGFEAHIGDDAIAVLTDVSTDRLSEVGADGDVGYAELDLTETGKYVAGISIPYKKLQGIIVELEKNPFLLGLYITTSDGSLKFDTKAISVLAAESQLAGNANLEIGFTNLDQSTLTPAQSTELSAYSIIRLFRVYAKCGSKDVKNLIGNLDVIIPYKVPTGMYWYKYSLKTFESDGSITDKIAINNEDEGSVSVTLNTLSGIAFGYEKCDGGFVCPSYWFDDVNIGDWYHEAVDFVVAAGYMNGLDVNTFSPNTGLTRGMIVTVLWRMQNKPSGKAGVFADVKSGAYYEEAIGWAQTVGIVNGYNSASFGPEDPITREQLAAILYRYSKFVGESIENNGNISGFSDSSEVSSYAIEEMKWANGMGLITGMTENRLCPKGNATRAQVAEILYRYESR